MRGAEEIKRLYRRARAAELSDPVEIPQVVMSWKVTLDRPRPRMFFRTHPDTFKTHSWGGVNKIALLKDPDGSFVGLSKHAPQDLKALAVYRVPVLCCPADGQLFVWPIPVDPETPGRRVAEVAEAKWIWTEWNPITMDYEIHPAQQTRHWWSWVKEEREPKWTPFLRAQIRSAIMSDMVEDWDHPVAKRIHSVQEAWKAAHEEIVNGKS